MPRFLLRVNSPTRPWQRSAIPDNRTFMIRIVLFLLFIALAAAGEAWIADQPGSIVLSWGGYKVTATVPVFALGLGILAVAVVVAWSIFTMLWRAPGRGRRARPGHRPTPRGPAHTPTLTPGGP